MKHVVALLILIVCILPAVAGDPPTNRHSRASEPWDTSGPVFRPHGPEPRPQGREDYPEVTVSTLVELDGSTDTIIRFRWSDREVSRSYRGGPGQRPPLVQVVGGVVYLGELIDAAIDGEPKADCCQCFGCPAGGNCSRDMGSGTCSSHCTGYNGCVCIQCWLDCKSTEYDRVDRDGIAWRRIDLSKSAGCEVSQ